MNVGSDGMGSWGESIVLPLLKHAFPKTTITQDPSRKYDLVVLSHFSHLESIPEYTCPYITWSGESRPVHHTKRHSPLFEINTAHTGKPNEVWIPHLITEIPHIYRPEPNMSKRWCCSYAFSVSISERERLFRYMRKIEPTCFAFGRSCFTPNNPFQLAQKDRSLNSKMFTEFAFNVAMENKIAPGYITEKIGHAFNSGSVPIYWGDAAAIKSFFNPESFICVNDFQTPESAAEYAVQLWRDPQKLQKYLDAPIIVNNNLAEYEAIRTKYRPWMKFAVDTLRDAFPDLS